jgi:hypothetical protein
MVEDESLRIEEIASSGDDDPGGFGVARHPAEPSRLERWVGLALRLVAGIGLLPLVVVLAVVTALVALIGWVAALGPALRPPARWQAAQSPKATRPSTPA